MYISYCQGKQDFNYACIDRNTLKAEKKQLSGIIWKTQVMTYLHDRLK